MDRMIHRGPDQEGQTRLGPAAFGHVRLSIIDLSMEGRQPMLNEDGSILLIFNGEIYNFRELRQKLESRHRFHSRSDSEILVHGYEEWGIEGLLARIRGMFAFAIWDNRKEVLHLARDHLGKKPLYYSQIGTGVAFASTLPAVLELLDTPPRVSSESIIQYLTFLSIPAPLSVFEGVFKLPPAHRLEFHVAGRQQCERYWRPDFSSKDHRSQEDWIEAIDHQLRAAVEERLVADVPLGAFLSGGVDSSLVVALASRITAKPMETFTADFKETGFSEAQHSRIVSDHLDTNHHELLLGPEALEVIPEIVSHHGEPFGDPSSLPLFHLSKFAHQHVSVVLTGDGGDESFGGYRNLQAVAAAERFRWLPDFIGVGLCHVVRRAERIGVPGARGFFWFAHSLAAGRRGIVFDPMGRRSFRFQEQTSFGWRLQAGTGAVTPDDLYARSWEEAGVTSWVDRALYVDLVRQLPNTFLPKVDVSTMAHSLEARSPLLDLRLVELACRIPARQKLSCGRSKYLLKRIAEGYVPREILYRRKQGFAVPIGQWFRGELGFVLEHILLSRQSEERGYLNMTGVRAMIEQHRLGQMDHGNRLWMLLMLELWFRMFVDRDIPNNARLSDLVPKSQSCSSFGKPAR